MTLKNICLWGDSIGKGVVFDEQRKRYAICRESCATMLSQIATLRNFSVMGQTTREGLARMKTADIAPNDVIAIEYGGNDCDLDWKSAAEHPDVSQYGKVPIDEFGDNLTEMIQIARGAGAEPMLVLPPPILSQRFFNWVSRGLNAAGILKYLGDTEAIYRWQAGYADRVRETAAAANVPLIDIRTPFMNAASIDSLYCIDGMHPNAEGQRTIFDAIRKYIP